MVLWVADNSPITDTGSMDASPSSAAQQPGWWLLRRLATIEAWAAGI